MLNCELIDLRMCDLQYTSDQKNPSAVPPETYTLDNALMSRPGNSSIQLDLFLDYRKNVDLYPAFKTYFKEKQPPVLAIWGKNDTIFIEAGARAFKPENSGLKDVEIDLVDGGHFLLENHLDEASEKILAFMEKRGL